MSWGNPLFWALVHAQIFMDFYERMTFCTHVFFLFLSAISDSEVGCYVLEANPITTTPQPHCIPRLMPGHPYTSGSTFLSASFPQSSPLAPVSQ